MRRSTESPRGSGNLSAVYDGGGMVLRDSRPDELVVRISGTPATGTADYPWVECDQSSATFPDLVGGLTGGATTLPVREITGSRTVAAGSKVRAFLNATRDAYLFAATGAGASGWGADSQTAAGIPAGGSSPPVTSSTGSLFLSTGAVTIDPALFPVQLDGLITVTGSMPAASKYQFGVDPDIFPRIQGVPGGNSGFGDVQYPITINARLVFVLPDGSQGASLTDDIAVCKITYTVKAVLFFNPIGGGFLDIAGTQDQYSGDVTNPATPAFAGQARVSLVIPSGYALPVGVTTFRAAWLVTGPVSAFGRSAPCTLSCALGNGRTALTYRRAF